MEAGELFSLQGRDHGGKLAGEWAGRRQSEMKVDVTL
jgi:mRNA-degrading endonuclease YafQ of YafQ-DinJ toxin-antitoxin module